MFHYFNIFNLDVFERRSTITIDTIILLLKEGMVAFQKSMKISRFAIH